MSMSLELWESIFSYQLETGASCHLLDDTMLSEAKKAYSKIAGDIYYHVKALTLTFRNRYKKFNNHALFCRFYSDLVRYIRCLPKPFYLELYPEMHADYSLHFHGVIAGNPAAIERFLKYYRRQYGFYVSKDPHDLSNWLLYCKSKGEFEYKKDMALRKQLGYIIKYKI